MSKMSELATALDEMTEVGRTLITCGESLLKAAAHVRDCFTEDMPAATEEPAPVNTIRAEDYQRLGIDYASCMRRYEEITKNRTALILKIRSNEVEEF